MHGRGSRHVRSIVGSSNTRRNSSGALESSHNGIVDRCSSSAGAVKRCTLSPSSSSGSGVSCEGSSLSASCGTGGSPGALPPSFASRLAVAAMGGVRAGLGCAAVGFVAACEVFSRLTQPHAKSDMRAGGVWDSSNMRFVPAPVSTTTQLGLITFQTAKPRTPHYIIKTKNLAKRWMGT